MQLNNFLFWRIKWSGMTLSLLIQLWIKGDNSNNYMEWDAIDILPQLEEQRICDDIIPQFNWESKVTTVSLTCNRIQLMDFLNSWWSNWFGMSLSLSIQLRIKRSNCTNYIKKNPSDKLLQFLVEQLIWKMTCF